MYKVLRHTCFAFEFFAINATSARLPHLKTLTWQTVTLTDSHYLADQATRLGGSTHLSCARDQDKIRNYTGRQVTSPTWGILPPCQQAITYHTENSTTHKLWLIKQMESFGYSIFVTQDTALSNCSRWRRRQSGDILCLVLNSCLIFRLLILQKVKTSHKTLTSPSVTLRKLSTAGLLILTLFNYY